MPRLLSILLALSVPSAGSVEATVKGVGAPGAPVPSSQAGDDAVACTLLEDIVPKLFGVDPRVVSFRPSSFRGQDTCRANWAPPEDRDSRQANQARLTILGTVYESDEAAVESLESTVATGGFGEWVEGVGDRAHQNETSVQVAASARRFTVSVTIVDDPARSRELMLELARAVADGL